MSIFEFQLSSHAFLAMQRNALRSLRTCRPTPFVVGGVALVIDRLEFGASAIRHGVETTFTHDYAYFSETRSSGDAGKATEVAQDVTVFVTTWQAVLSAPNQAPPVSAFKIRLVFELNFSYADADQCFLGMSLLKVEPVGLPPLPSIFSMSLDAVMAFVTTEIRTLVPARSIPVNLGGMLPSGMHIANAGMSLDGQGAIVAFRLQNGRPPYGEVDWRNFHSGFFHDNLLGKDFSFYVEADFVTEALKVQINQALREVDVDELDTRVGCEYSHANNQATFTINVLAMYDLPDPLGTLDVEPRIPVVLSVPEPNVVEVDANFTGIVALVDFFLGVIGMFAPAFVDPIEAFLEASVDAAISDVNADGELGEVKVTPAAHVIARRRVRVPSPLTGTNATLTTLLAQERGIALAGTLHTTELTYSTPALGTATRKFQIRAPKVDCGRVSLSIVAAFQSDPQGTAVIHGQASLDEDGSVPVYLCDIRVINDPRGAFPRRAIRVVEDQTPLVLSIDIPVPPLAYYDQPYPCDVIVVTTGGTRLLRLAPPPKFTVEDAKRLAAELLVQVGNCAQLVAPWFRYKNGYDPRWSIDPARRFKSSRLWQFDIVGARTGELASVTTQSGVELARVMARDGAPLHVSVVTDPAAGDALTITRLPVLLPALALLSRGVRDAGADEARGIAVGQQNLDHLAEVALPGRCVQLVATNARRRGVFAVQEEGVLLLNLAAPSRPARDNAWRTERNRGALDWRGALLLFGDHGFTTIQGGAHTRLSEGRCTADLVLGAAVGAGVVYALRSDRLDVLRPDAESCCLDLVRSEELPAARSLIRIGRTLGVLCGERLVALDISDPLKPERAASYDVPGVSSLTRPAGLGANSFLAARGDCSAMVITLGEDGFRETAHYAGAPWFTGSLRLGALLVQPSSAGRSLRISRFGASNSV